MTNCEPGDVVLVWFPFTDAVRKKKRPGVVISPPAYFAQHEDSLIMALTSRPQSESELFLVHWRAAGLPKPTWVKPTIGTIASTFVERRLGKLAGADRSRVASALRMLIAQPFLKLVCLPVC
jgi:mRNA interferase MazF